MKIVCDACQAKYSIADEKVKGKVFKIRCKKCSNEIVVRGNAKAEEPSIDAGATRVQDYAYDPNAAAADAVWHVVIDGEQVGPITDAEVRKKFSSGVLDGESYIWKEGFADWVPINGVPEFSGLSTSNAATIAAPGADVADEGATRRYEPSYARPASQPDPMADLFGAQASQPVADPASSKLRGERNENSVLFSLGSLTAMAQSNAPTRSKPSTLSPSKSAVTEGSGLIDIRSLAASVQGPRDTKSPHSSLGVGSLDDLPVFTANTFNEPAVILAPPSRGGGGGDLNKKLLYAVVGLGVLLVATMAFALLRGGGGAASGGSQGDNPGPVAAKVDARPAVAKVSIDAKPAVAVVLPDAPVAAVAPSEPVKKPDKDTQAVVRIDPPRDTPPKKPEKEPADDAKAGTCDAVSCLVNDSDPCCKKFRRKDPPAGGGGGGTDSSLPDSLSRTMVSDGISKVAGKMSACDRGIKGTVKIKVKVSPSGSVTSASVVSTPDASLGNCVASAIQKASFAKTQTGGSFSYPKTF